ncbi:MAG: ABC transporter ATP-binding protein, partial [Pisciglobus halotolerans]|nr:ABC transporter ATP-binding protein [Pisciglobus halotolerans]
MAQEQSETEKPLDKKMNKQNVKRVLNYLKPYLKKISILFLVILLSNLILILGPFLASIVIDQTIQNNDIRQLVSIIIFYAVA